MSAPKLGDNRKTGGACFRWPNARFVSIAQAAEELGVPYGEVYALVRKGAIRALRLGDGRKYRIDRKDLERYIETCKKNLEGELAS